MSKNNEELESRELANIIVQGMQEKKANDIVVMDLKNVKNAVADFFILCSGNSDTQIDAISESVEEVVEKNTDQNPWNKEGLQNKSWVLIDYVDVVAHIFRNDTRLFYNLEDLWGDAKLAHITENNS